MKKVYFCNMCRKLFDDENVCTCQGEGNVKEAKLGTPVNVIGTKIKGKIYRMGENTVDVLITSNKNKGIKTYEFAQVRKIL